MKILKYLKASSQISESQYDIYLENFLGAKLKTNLSLTFFTTNITDIKIYNFNTHKLMDQFCNTSTTIY